MRYRLADRHGKFLATRSRGAQVQEALLAALEETPEGDHLVIDFADVEDVTVSFIDESMGGLLAKRVNDETLSARGVILADLNADCEDAVDAVLKRRETAVVAVNAAGNMEILGYRGWGWMPETLEASRRLGECSRSDLVGRPPWSPHMTGKVSAMNMKPWGADIGDQLDAHTHPRSATWALRCSLGG